MPLKPFVDDNGILRVGGRIRRSELPYDAKHQILLPRNHRLNKLIIEHEHLRNLHAGPELLLTCLRQRYWIIDGMSYVRHFCRNCFVCRKLKALTLDQIMGDLPKNRICPSRAFLKTGVDYAGPIMIKTKKGRGARSVKAWIAYFVCMATKAAHIEVVSDLTTDCFIAAFRRFTARRGKVQHMYSDNATTFHGADRALKDFVSDYANQDQIAKALAKDGIQWNYSPQKASHFGGLWEACIKSMKCHLYRVMGNCLLTYEELNTLLCQVEACLNSRPIAALSSDPNDFNALIPGHFLIGAPLSSLPDCDLTDVKQNRLDRWQQVQQFYQQIWRRWSREYLNSLQERTKWATGTERNIAVGDLVLMYDENSSPLKWPLSCGIQLHPDTEGVVRVATVRTANSVFKRPIVKLSLLIPQEDL